MRNFWRIKIRKYNFNVWLDNTGWTGGPYGIGHRMKLSHTRKMHNEAISGNLIHSEYYKEPVFGLSIPVSVPGVPKGVLVPGNSWKDIEAYDEKANQLAKMFSEHYKQFKQKAAKDVINAGPLPA